jgi:hypothetical protein
MKVKNLLPIFNGKKVRIRMADSDVEWCGHEYSKPKKYYKIDKVCSFPCEYSNRCTYIFIK